MPVPKPNEHIKISFDLAKRILDGTASGKQAIRGLIIIATVFCVTVVALAAVLSH
jgi:hypothetical protein